MAERIRWFVPNRVIWVEPNPVITTNTLKEENEAVVEMIRQAFYSTELPVYVIVDSSRIVSQPSPIEARRLLTYLNEPGLGYRIVAGVGDTNHYFFSKFAGMLNPECTLVFPTISQALSVLCRKDKTLPDLLEVYQAQEADKI